MSTEILTPEGEIRPEQVEDLLVEVISGKHLFIPSGHPEVVLASRNPMSSDQNSARIIYSKRLAEARANEVKTRAEIEEFALRTGIFDRAGRREKEALQKLIVNRSKARQQTTDPTQKVELDAEIAKMRKRIIELELPEEMVFRNSAEAMAEEARISFYICRCTMGGDLLEQPVWESWDEYQSCNDMQLILDARTAFHRIHQGMPDPIVRALARTDQWRSIWRPAKETGASPFEGPASSWDRSKQRLIYWSDFYDSIYQHPDCPPEDVLRNDEYLQDWLNQQLARRQAHKSASSAAGGIGKSPPMIRQGDGSLRPMKKISETNIPVNTPYRIRTKNG